LNAGVKWVLKQGMDNLHRQELALWKKLLHGIQEVPGVITYYTKGSENRNAVISMNIRGFESSDVGTMLDVDYNIATRTGLHCAPKVHELIGTADIHGSVRLSIGPFNTEEQIDHTIAAIKEIASIRN
jgi:selenocysteine lyase/cysteine desulfurase